MIYFETQVILIATIIMPSAELNIRGITYPLGAKAVGWVISLVPLGFLIYFGVEQAMACNYDWVSNFATLWFQSWSKKEMRLTRLLITLFRKNFSDRTTATTTTTRDTCMRSNSKRWANRARVVWSMVNEHHQLDWARAFPTRASSTTPLWSRKRPLLRKPLLSTTSILKRYESSRDAADHDLELFFETINKYLFHFNFLS